MVDEFRPIQPNPYIVGNPIRDRGMFFGRQEELRFLHDRLGIVALCQQFAGGIQCQELTFGLIRMEVGKQRLGRSRWLCCSVRIGSGHGRPLCQGGNHPPAT